MNTALMAMPSFEELSALARSDPGAFEALRGELVEDFIAHAPQRLKKRLRGLQFRIDGQRRIARSDYAAALKLFGMMWDSFDRLAGLWRELPDELRHGSNQRLAPPAKILYLPNPARASIRS